MTSQQPDIVVVGGGIMGLACARGLAARGLAVTVLERDRLARASSWAAAGMLAPLAEVPEPGALFDACRASRDAWAYFAPALEEETGIALDYDRSGALVLGGSGRNVAAIEAAAGQLGEHAERLARADARALIPDLSPRIDDVVLLAGEHRVSNRAVCRALARSVARRGVELREGWAVEQVRPRSGGWRVMGPSGSVDAPRLLICAGAWSGGIAGLPRLPVRPVRGQMMRLDGVTWPWRGSVRGDLYAVRRAGDGLLVGATMEDVGFDDRTTVAGERQLLEACTAMFPGLGGHAVVERWSGLRPGTDDDRPIVGPIEDGVWAATGHFRNGILLAPWTVEVVVAGMVDDIAPALAWRASRFQPSFLGRA